MECQGKNKADIIPDRFEVYSPWTQRAAGIGGIIVFSSFVSGLACTAYFLLDPHDSFSYFAFPFLLFFMLLFSNLIVKLFRFNLGRKIVIDKDSLTVGGRSWDVLSLTKYVEVSIADGSEFNRYTTHEYTVFDKSGKAVAHFDWNYVNAGQLKKWLQEGGSEKVCKEPCGFLYYLRSLFHICEQR